MLLKSPSRCSVPKVKPCRWNVATRRKALWRVLIRSPANRVPLAKTRSAQPNQCATIRSAISTSLRRSGGLLCGENECARWLKPIVISRAAIEATCRAVKCRYPKGKFPVRGKFRMLYLLISSAAMNNLRQIQRFLVRKSSGRLEEKGRLVPKGVSSSMFFGRLLRPFRDFARFLPLFS